MTEDKLLLRRLKRGDRDALAAIYEKYESTLLTLAAGLLRDSVAAEDVLQDVLVSLVRSVHRLNVRGSLKAYLATAVANRTRDYYRRKPKQSFSSIDTAPDLAAADKGPVQMVICSEQVRKLQSAMVELPYEQREAIMLHLHADMTFREIANSQNVSVKTALSRYRYGLDKLRTKLNGEVRDERK